MVKKESKTEFEKLIKQNEENLQLIRNIYFRAIANRLITGYNIYQKQPTIKGKLFLNYLHSELKRENKHLKELKEKLKKENVLEDRIIIIDELINRNVIERHTDYITHTDWTDPPTMRYFTLNGRELKPNEAKKLEDEVIGESLQYDLLIKINNEEELRKLIDLFKKYTSKYKLDKKGVKIPKGIDFELNPFVISDAWEIPLLIVTNKENKKPKRLNDFLQVKQFDIPQKLGKTEAIVSTLVGNKTKAFSRFLDKIGAKVKPIKKYALRTFVEDYIDT